ncbi:MAG: hypothetical protein IKH26_11990 [Bacteroidaceae bacterium]|nr:hypothetical protein [Bacteroidaceae bacterium]
MKKSTPFRLGRAVMTVLFMMIVFAGAQAQTHVHSWKVTHASVSHGNNPQLDIHVKCTICGVSETNIVATEFHELEVPDPDKPNKTITVYCFDAETSDGFQFVNYYYSPNNKLVVAPLEDTQNNAELILGLPTDKSIFVFLNGRTLYKDGYWNTLCLPFSLTTDQVSEQLAPDQLMTLSRTEFADGTLTMTFSTATTIEAGKPYIIKWNGGDNLVNPMFVGVTMTQTPASSIEKDHASFKGTYAPVPFSDDDKTVMFLGGESTLYYPESNASTNAFRGYFKLADGYVCGEPKDELNVNRFELHYGNGEASAIVRINNDGKKLNDDAWYTLSGMRLNQQPASQGLYIHNGKKVMIK